MITREEIEKALPTHMRVRITDKFVDTLNNLSTDPLLAQNLRENFMSYSNVLRDGIFKLEDYLRAVAYVSFKTMGHNNQESYQRTFPDRHAILVARGASKKDISAYVAAYDKNKLVNLVQEQALIPIWILNQDAVQKAINTQVELMTSANSELVRTQAANSILTHLKKPESKQVDLNVNIPENDDIAQLKKAVQEIAVMSKEAINNGVTTKQIAHQAIIIEG